MSSGELSPPTAPPLFLTLSARVHPSTFQHRHTPAMRGGGRQCKQCVQKSNYIKASPLSLAMTWVSLFTDLSVWNPGPDLGFVFIFYLKIRPRWPPSVVLGMESWRTADNGARSRGGRGLHTHPLSWEGAGSKHSTSPAEIAASVQVESRLLLIFFCSCAKHGSGLRGLNDRRCPL